MRRRQLSQLGFHTGSPFAPEQRMSSLEWRTRLGQSPASPSPSSLPPSRSGSASGAASPRVLGGGVRTGAASRSGSQMASPARPIAGTGTRAPLDPGRLAAARSTYERISSAPQRSPPAASAASAVAASAGTAVPAASPSRSSAPVSRRASASAAAATKRRREDSTTSEESDNSDTQRRENNRQQQKRRREDARVKQEATGDKAAPARSLSPPPPLESAAGTLVPSPLVPPSSATAASAIASAASSSAVSSSSTFAESTPLSSLVPSAPPPLTLREKSAHMFEECLHAAVRQGKEETKQEGDTDVAAASSAAAAAAPEAPSVPPFTTDPATLASQLEQHLFEFCGQAADAAYRQRLRALVFNFKSHTALCLRMLRGELLPEAVVRMDDKQLASDDVAAERERMRQSSFDAAVYKPTPRVASSDYRCDSCGSSDCSTLVIREERDISKADTWGSKQGAGSVIEIKCEACGHLWTKEE